MRHWTYGSWDAFCAIFVTQLVALSLVVHLAIVSLECENLANTADRCSDLGHCHKKERGWRMIQDAASRCVWQYHLLDQPYRWKMLDKLLDTKRPSSERRGGE